MRYSLLQKKCNNMFFLYSSVSDITFAILVFQHYCFSFFLGTIVVLLLLLSIFVLSSNIALLCCALICLHSAVNALQDLYRSLNNPPVLKGWRVMNRSVMFLFICYTPVIHLANLFFLLTMPYCHKSPKPYPFMVSTNFMQENSRTKPHWVDWRPT